MRRYVLIQISLERAKTRRPHPAPVTAFSGSPGSGCGPGVLRGPQKLAWGSARGKPVNLLPRDLHVARTGTLTTLFHSERAVNTPHSGRRPGGEVAGLCCLSGQAGGLDHGASLKGSLVLSLPRRGAWSCLVPGNVGAQFDIFHSPHPKDAQSILRTCWREHILRDLALRCRRDTKGEKR